MIDYFKQLSMYIILVLILLLVLFLAFRDWSSEEYKVTRDKLDTWAEKLDKNVKPSGVYIQWESEDLPEIDGWGTALKVIYRNEGIAERVFVTSAGEDKLWNTKDDLKTSRMQINGKGIGVGIKENAASVTKDATKGAISGVKEEVADTASNIKEGVKNKAGESTEKAKKFFGDLKNRFKKDDK